MKQSRRRSQPLTQFGSTLASQELTSLTAELQKLRDHPPLIRRSDGKYEGAILGFVKGLRLSARVIYFLREYLSSTDLEINWGHLLDKNQDSCSPECDIIVHQKGHVRKWNGNDKPVMDFKFVEAGRARAVVSCKSILTAIDKDYAKGLRKYGVRNVFLFAECCEEKRLPRLREQAVKAGYRGLWCLYLTQGPIAAFKTDDSMYTAFGNAVLKAVKR